MSGRIEKTSEGGDATIEAGLVYLGTVRGIYTITGKVTGQSNCESTFDLVIVKISFDEDKVIVGLAGEGHPGEQSESHEAEEQRRHPGASIRRREEGFSQGVVFEGDGQPVGEDMLTRAAWRFGAPAASSF